VRRQSDHLADYRAALDRLAAMGLLYPSFESRADIAALVKAREADGIWPRDPDGVPLYPGAAKALPADERERRLRSGAAYALRLDMDAACRVAGDLAWIERGSGPDGQTGDVVAWPKIWGDVILARKDAPTSYHLSVVIDDALQGVTDVVRGQDLFWSTAVHRLLQKILDLPQPVYRHHDLIRDGAGKKLSKSSEATGLRDLRARGMTAGEVRGLIGLP
jgi:glutamyl-Q tRNA(Asp) synthetase